jgi:hypothetical protein
MKEVYWRRKENDLQAMTQFLHIFDCRMETVEAASSFCDRYDYSVVTSDAMYGPITNNIRSYTHQLESFTRYEWIERQSFCFEGKSSLTLTPVIAVDGLCFTLNGDQNIFNREMWAFDFRSCLEVHISFRVAADFFSNKTVTMSCTDNQKLTSKKSLSMNVVDNRTDVCYIDIFSLYAHEKSTLAKNWIGDLLINLDRSFVLKPKIMTTDENARPLSPQV